MPLRIIVVSKIDTCVSVQSKIYVIIGSYPAHAGITGFAVDSVYGAAVNVQIGMVVFRCIYIAFLSEFQRAAVKVNGLVIDIVIDQNRAFGRGGDGLAGGIFQFNIAVVYIDDIGFPA